MLHLRLNAARLCSLLRLSVGQLPHYMQAQPRPTKVVDISRCYSSIQYCGWRSERHGPLQPICSALQTYSSQPTILSSSCHTPPAQQCRWQLGCSFLQPPFSCTLRMDTSGHRQQMPEAIHSQQCTIVHNFDMHCHLQQHADEAQPPVFVHACIKQ